jgi:hypothetical protein
MKQLYKKLESIFIQRDGMIEGMGMTFKPKPILQFEEFGDQENGRIVIIMKPCGFYNPTLHCMDVVVTPCKHTFYHYCLGVMLK